MTRTKRPASDKTPAFSPDGRRLAYVSCTGDGATCNVYVLDLDVAYRPTARSSVDADPGLDPRSRLESRWPRPSSTAETHGGARLFGAWRLPATARPERLEVAGLGAMDPATVLSRDRLAFARSFLDIDVYRFQPGRPPEPVVTGSFGDLEAQFSPDGRRIVFGTTRAGEVW